LGAGFQGESTVFRGVSLPKPSIDSLGEKVQVEILIEEVD
jgi:hypothetical protein